MLLRKQAIICCYIFPPHLINASTLPCDTENTEIVNSLLFFEPPCISCPSRKLPNSVKLRGGWLLRRSRSFKVTDFGTNRKLICDFLLVINSNLPPILHRFQVTVQFSLARVNSVKCLTLTLSLGEIPYKYRRKWYIPKILILWPTFPPLKVSVYL